MNREQILHSLQAFFLERRPAEQLESFESLRAADVLASSVEAMDLVFHLEEVTGVELGLAEVGPAVASLTFGDLAGEIQRIVQSRSG